MTSLRCLLLSAAVLPVFAVQAERVVLPVAIFAAGTNQSLWATEIAIEMAVHARETGGTNWSPLTDSIPNLSVGAISVATAADLFKYWNTLQHVMIYDGGGGTRIPGESV